MAYTFGALLAHVLHKVIPEDVLLVHYVYDFLFVHGCFTRLWFVTARAVGALLNRIHDQRQKSLELQESFF